MLLQQLINGVTLGAIYALIALGYTLVYGILRMINFAHSEVFMGGAFLGLATLGLVGRSWLPAGGQVAIMVVVAMLGCAFLGMALERIAYRPLRRAPRLTPLISAIGASLVLQNAIFLFVSDQSLTFRESLPVVHWRCGGAELNSLQLLILTLAVGCMVVLRQFILKTRLGQAMRATAQDSQTAQLMGVNINQIIALTFFLGGALGGAAGVLNGMYYGSIKYNMGFILGIKAFTAAVLGGIGNITGAMAGGFLLGILEALGAGFLPGGAEWKDVFAFVVLILVLLVKPSGLLGQHVPEKL
ncbi:MAG: branched-chain amino acid ABC transporter permease [Elusimicrobia bacterium]|nr:branched-chain amino acid ABC transporter permease [Elusimicrobiota bacterium]